MANIPQRTYHTVLPVPAASESSLLSCQGTVPTRIVLISDTHSVPLYGPGDKKHCFRKPLPEADILIHAGDLTNHGSLRQHEATFKVLAEANAELKLVIAGNHDTTLDREYYTRDPIGSEAEQEEQLQEENELVDSVRELWTGQRAKDHRIYFLDEGVHTFRLSSGAQFNVYASPWTPEFCDWAFNYPHTIDRWNPPRNSLAPNPIPSFPDIDILVTHGPPAGILDLTSSGVLAGCDALWKAVQRCRPRLHVFGHIHESFGAEVFNWVNDRKTQVDSPNDSNIVLERGWVGFDATGGAYGKLVYDRAGTRPVLEDGKEALQFGKQTLFVNASIMNVAFQAKNAVWCTDIMLPGCTS